MFVPTPDRITRGAAIALGALALTGPAAQAMPMYDPAKATSAQYVLDRPSSDQLTVVADDGFDWQTSGIAGASVMFALFTLAYALNLRPRVLRADYRG